MTKPPCQGLPSAAPTVISSNIPFFLETNQPSCWITNARSHHPDFCELPVLDSWLDSSEFCCCGPCSFPVPPVPALFWALLPAGQNPRDAPRDPPAPVVVLLLSLLQSLSMFLETILRSLSLRKDWFEKSVEIPQEMLFVQDTYLSQKWQNP